MAPEVIPVPTLHMIGQNLGGSTSLQDRVLGALYHMILSTLMSHSPAVWVIRDLVAFAVPLDCIKESTYELIIHKQAQEQLFLIKKNKASY